MLYLALGFAFTSVGLVAYQLIPHYQSRINKLPSREVKVAAVDKMSRKLNAIFIDIPSKRLLHMYLGLLVGLGLAGVILTKNILGLFIGVSIALIMPNIIIKKIAARRRTVFKAQLIDALMILSSSLKAGLSLIQAIGEIVTEMPAPISQEFGLLLRENRMGVPLEQTFLHLKKRMDLEELDLVVTAILVARETGGDLTRTFSRLTLTIREKNKLIGRVKSLCTQAKLQGIIMIMLPIVFAIAVFGFNPTFFNIMLENKIGQALLVYAVISECLGAFFIRKFSRIEV